MSLQEHQDKLLYMCFYFKYLSLPTFLISGEQDIGFNIDILPTILRYMDDVYLDFIFKDAIAHGWTDSIYCSHRLSPPSHFVCHT
jgi:hypothetical protein